MGTALAPVRRRLGVALLAAATVLAVSGTPATAASAGALAACTAANGQDAGVGDTGYIDSWTLTI
ncbi:hypothetical protein ACFQO7_12760 [Catellatospora aurea]|uniref:Uncharacterized protein n=1 Tax=Catellatospora aurea TaxID=1337874 RepID=A0ABW2GTY9_9ACTN